MSRLLFPSFIIVTALFVISGCAESWESTPDPSTIPPARPKFENQITPDPVSPVSVTLPVSLPADAATHFDDHKGNVTEERRHLIARKIVEVLRLPVHRR